MTELITLPLPPVPSAQPFIGEGKLLTQASQQWLINLRDKVNQINSVLITISGAGSTAEAFNSISPLTTTGDMIVYSGGTNTRLPIGSNGQVLTVVSGLPVWQSGSAGSSPLTTKGDIYGYGTAPARIPVGTDGYTLTADSSNALGVSWKPTNYSTRQVTTSGQTAITFSSLPQTGNNLKLVIRGSGTAPAGTGLLMLMINGDSTSTNYMTACYVGGQNSTNLAGNIAPGSLGTPVGGWASGANPDNVIILEIINYSSVAPTLIITSYVFTESRSVSSDLFVGKIASGYNTSAAVTSITLTAATAVSTSQAFTVGSSAELFIQ